MIGGKNVWSRSAIAKESLLPRPGWSSAMPATVRCLRAPHSTGRVIHASSDVSVAVPFSVSYIRSPT
jgi:hypothetical protein